MLTKEAADEKKKAGQDAGATAWRVEPFNPEPMLEAIKKLLPKEHDE